MCATWNIDPTLIAVELSKLRTSRTKAVVLRTVNGVQFDGFLFDEIVAFLNAHTDFQVDAPQYTCKQLLSNAISIAAQDNDITHGRIRRELTKQENSYRKLPNHRFEIATSVSMRTPTTYARSTWLGRTITFNETWPSYFTSSKTWGFACRRYVEIPKHYCVARARVNAKTFDEASSLGLEAINLLRGVWNLDLNFRQYRRSMAMIPPPVNKLTPGPFALVRNEDSKQIWNLACLNSDYCSSQKVQVLDNSTIDRLKKHCRRIRYHLNMHPYSQEMVSCFVRYADALDTRDLDKSLVKTWSLLEQLTDTTERQSEVTIDRTLKYVDQNKTLDRRLLNRLARYRNRHVHANYSSQDVEQLLFQLKTYPELMLLYHLTKGKKHNSMSDASAALV